ERKGLVARDVLAEHEQIHLVVEAVKLAVAAEEQRGVARERVARPAPAIARGGVDGQRAQDQRRREAAANARDAVLAPVAGRVAKDWVRERGLGPHQQLRALALEIGGYALEIGEQLGRRARVRGLERVVAL